MKKILLIEDDAVLREMYQDKFLKEKFDVQTAVDGQEGLSKIKSFLPDVIILDLLMPKVSGFDVLKSIKDDQVLNKIPMIVLTNIFADAEDLVKNWGVDYLLLKANSTPEEVLDRIKQILG